jgi:ribosomal protein S12 methylthiotransferase
VAFISLGCAKNLVNTEQMAAQVSEAGFILVPDADGADVAVLNTCGFIDSAKSEAIEHILMLAQLKQEGRLQKILVAGCLAERYREEILAELPEVDGLIGCGSFQDVAAAIGETLSGGIPVLFGDLDVPEVGRPRLLSTPPWMAYLKIAEGCDNRCAYCVIPSLRGRYRSRSLEDLLAEAEGLAALGVKELIVVAQDITRYGIDLYGRRRLSELLRALCRIGGIRWIRLHYLYPDEIDEELIGTIAGEEKILNYLDIPIQHVSDSILRAMNRRAARRSWFRCSGNSGRRSPAWCCVPV